MQVADGTANLPEGTVLLLGSIVLLAGWGMAHMAVERTLCLPEGKGCLAFQSWAKGHSVEAAHWLLP